MTSMRKNTWASGEHYEPYGGRWSRMVAHTFLWVEETPVGPGKFRHGNPFACFNAVQPEVDEQRPVSMHEAIPPVDADQ